MGERWRFEVADSTIQNFFNDFETEIVPYGRAGSDPKFAEVCKKLLDFVQCWDKWFQGYLES